MSDKKCARCACEKEKLRDFALKLIADVEHAALKNKRLDYGLCIGCIMFYKNKVGPVFAHALLNTVRTDIYD